MKKFCVWDKKGESKIIESNSVATVEKTKHGLQIKIGKTKIKNAMGFTEVSEQIQVK